MNNISKILIPFNFQESAVNALNYALAFSKKSVNTDIVLLYVMIDNTDENKEDVESRLSDISENSSSKYSSVNVSFLIETGDLVEKVIQTLKSSASDLIIVGTKGKNERSKHENSNTSKLIQQTNCPVLVIPKAFNEYKLENITLAIDKTKLEQADILTILLVIARRFDAKIHVLTVYDENDDDSLKDRENESTLEYYFERYYETSSITRSTNIAQSIIDYDTKRSIDMLAIIPHHHSGTDVKSEGKLAQYFAINTDIPILIIA